LFTGFREGNQQHRANGFDYGLDNWLYGANGESGGRVRSLATGKTVNINGRDFRFRPDDGAFETQAGQTQYGRHRDDWGNWFGNNNSSGAWHYFLQEQYLGRNPYVAAPATHQVMPAYPEFSRVFPASRLAQRFNDPWGANHLTSANSAMPYRDQLFGSEFERSYFVSEPVHNLVHREIMEPDGVSFTSHRAADEQQSEFFASSDNWCRPTMTKTGPDGALYIADMYRLVIEHPEWIPEDFQRSVNLRAGAGMGRIYRVYPTNAVLRTVPRLDQLTTDELVAAMESPNGWQRDTIQRLLVCAADKAAVAPLERLFLRSKNPKVRLQALCTLDGVHTVSARIAVAALRDQHPAVRENAVRICESLAEKSAEIQQAMLALADDPEIRVRFQLAFSLGEVSSGEAGKALAKIALRDAEDDRVQLAIRTSAPRHLQAILSEVVIALQHGSSHSSTWNLFRDLTSLSVALELDAATIQALDAIVAPAEAGRPSWHFAGVAGLLEGLGRRGMTLDQFRSASKGELKKALEQLDTVFANGRKAAADSSLAEQQRIVAIRLLGRRKQSESADLDLLAKLLGAQNSLEIRAAALSNLKQLRNPGVADVLVSAWKGSSPSGRDEIITLLLGRREWSRSLLTAIQDAKIPAAAIGTAQKQKLLTHPDQDIQAQARKVFTAANSDREAVVQKYLAAIQREGDPRRGRLHFQQNCIPCHRLRDEGNEVGADLGSVATKPLDYLVTSILDPNRSVEARYMSYSATMKDELEYTGIIVGETANNITLRQAGGKDVILLRGDLKELNGGTRSLMPDGFENNLGPEAIADLVAYIKAPRGN
jgi:putative membrane-bound dehydrogenase-like protein